MAGKRPTVLRHPGSHLREARRAKGWTQRECADALGISTQYVSDLELGRRRVSFDLAQDLAVTFPSIPASSWVRMQYEHDWSAFLATQESGR